MPALGFVAISWPKPCASGAFGRSGPWLDGFGFRCGAPRASAIADREPELARAAMNDHLATVEGYLREYRIQKSAAPSDRGEHAPLGA